jgi:hypothetical protein
MVTKSYTKMILNLLSNNNINLKMQSRVLGIKKCCIFLPSPNPLPMRRGTKATHLYHAQSLPLGGDLEEQIKNVQYDMIHLYSDTEIFLPLPPPKGDNSCNSWQKRRKCHDKSFQITTCSKSYN